MAQFNLPEFSINEETANEDINHLLKTIKPHWNSRDVDILSISGGFSCSTYRVKLTNDHRDAVTIRVRKLFSSASLPIIDHEYERKIVQVASKSGIFPKIYALFKNGYCYQYIEGKPLVNWVEKMKNPEDSKNSVSEDIPFKIIAEKLAQIHCITLDDEDFSKTDIYEKYLQTLEENYPQTDPTMIEKDVIRKELSEMIRYANMLNMKIVLCHGDTHPGNMVWNKEEGKLTFVDWELTHVGYQVYDIVYFLKVITPKESMGISDMPDLPTFITDPSEKLQEDFVQFYLEEYSRLTTGSTNMSNEYLKEMNNHLKFATLMLHLSSIILFGSLKNQLMDSGLPIAYMVKTIANLFDLYVKTKDDVLRELKLK